MFNIGPGELIVILILALVLLGPEKLPEMARTVGKGMRELRRATEDLKDQVESEFYKLDENKPAPSVKAPEGPRYAKAEPAALPSGVGPAAGVAPAAPVAPTAGVVPTAAVAPAAVPESTPTPVPPRND